MRIVVPEAYGFKSIKWLSHVVLTNLPHANDTYADGNNDVDSPLKTFAATLSVPRKIKAGQPIPITGYAQVGICGLSKVQVWIQPDGQAAAARTIRYFATAPWTDAANPAAAETLGRRSARRQDSRTARTALIPPTADRVRGRCD